MKKKSLKCPVVLEVPNVHASPLDSGSGDQGQSQMADLTQPVKNWCLGGCLIVPSNQFIFNTDCTSCCHGCNIPRSTSKAQHILKQNHHNYYVPSVKCLHKWRERYLTCCHNSAVLQYIDNMERLPNWIYRKWNSVFQVMTKFSSIYRRHIGEFVQSIVVLLTFVCLLPLCTGQTQSNQEYTCTNIDVRNSVDNFTKLENCTVIEGHLQIALINEADPLLYEKFKFPKLIEIKDYLLVYHVNGLKTLRLMFPNLSVIRGQRLFHNYALVIREAFQMQDIGLHNLSVIEHGGVRLELNPNLCNVDTIDWNKITRGGEEGNFIKDNKKMCIYLKPPVHCKYFWNRFHCQKECPDDCKDSGCSEDGKCCDTQCLGGCYGSGSDKCFACRGVRVDNNCLSKCPGKYLEFMGRRCVTPEECQLMDPPLLRNLPREKMYKIHDRKCVLECPPGHEEECINGKRTCKKCRAHCPKECNGAIIVDSIASAQTIRGCTHVKGSLEIKMDGGKNIAHELETNLGMIEEVEDYVKIYRSDPLVSLNFLKNLKVVHGRRLENEEYSLVVLYNQNLQELWDWNKTRKDRDLSIRRGKLFFHFNPKLCLHLIEELKNITKLGEFDPLDVSRYTNGDQAACNKTRLSVDVVDIRSETATIQYDNFAQKLNDPRSLLSYEVAYQEAPANNLTFFEGRDACGGSSWKIIEFPAQKTHLPGLNSALSKEDITKINQTIFSLKPYTQYGLYMRTLTIGVHGQGARSDIIYFTTKPSKPKPPSNLRAEAVNSTSIKLSWEPPKEPNGQLVKYIVIGTPIEDSYEDYEGWDICGQGNPVISSVIDPNPSRTPQGTLEMELLDGGLSPENLWVTADGRACCQCQADEMVDAEKKSNQNKFEDYIQNIVFVKKHEFAEKCKAVKGDCRVHCTNRYGITHTREKRQLNPGSGVVDASKAVVKVNTTLEKKDIIKHEFVHKDIPVIEVKLSQLHHYKEYIVEVQACIANYSNPCSESARTRIRTKPVEGADDVISDTVVVDVSNHTTGSVRVHWEKPTNPNGLVIGFDIQHKRRYNENYQPYVHCITMQQYLDNNQGCLIEDLSPGEYSLSVRARTNTPSGYGQYTKPTFFVMKDMTSGISTGYIVLIVILLFLLVGVIAVACLRRRKIKDMDAIIYSSRNPEYLSANLVYSPDDSEVPRDKVKLVRELGQGSFGMVYEGVVTDMDNHPGEIRVAVKTINETVALQSRFEILKEATLMKKMRCKHVVQLIGVVSITMPPYVLMEFMANADLKTYLRLHRPDSDVDEGEESSPPSLTQIYQWAAEIADGMAYLEDNKLVHRDLAARNCMVSESLVVKIGDFGMTRDVNYTNYYRKDGKGLLPVRWMAPESLKDGVFTSKSDVWSYGVVLWEIATLASQPYQGLSNEQVLVYVRDGRTMERPDNCPDRLYELMHQCWSHLPRYRPRFIDIVSELIKDCTEEFRQNAFYTDYMVRQEHPEDVPPSDPCLMNHPDNGDGDHGSNDSLYPPVGAVSNENSSRNGMSFMSSDGSLDRNGSNNAANGYLAKLHLSQSEC